jgi:hypothetical protein
MLLINCKNHVDKINRELDGQEIVSVTVFISLFKFCFLVG